MIRILAIALGLSPGRQKNRVPMKAMCSARLVVASLGAAVLLLHLSALPASSQSPSIDIETMKLKRVIDKPHGSTAIAGGVGRKSSDGSRMHHTRPPGKADAIRM